MSEVVRHVVASIGAASVVHGEAARQAVAGAGAEMLERLARAVGAAQHTARPRVARRAIVVVAGDHGIGDPGIAMGADHPTVIAARAIAAGSAALADVARAAGAPIVLADAGIAERAYAPSIAIALAPGRPSAATEPGMTPVDAVAGLEAGIALSLSIEADVIALGALGVGAEVASAALLGAAAGGVPALGDPVAEAAGARAAATRLGALDLLATFGGPDTAVLAGLILGAASINVPVILDSYATGAAMLVAARFAPAVAGYAIAGHRGSFTQPAILAHLGLSPIFEVGLGHGEGTGAAMVLPLLDQVAALAGAH